MLPRALPNAEADRCLMVVGPYQMLSQWHDADQHWFDFMIGVTFSVRKAATRPKVYHPYRASRASASRASAFARLPDGARKLFVYERGVHQYVLPFYDGKRISHKQIKLLAEADYPTWDRTESGDIFRVEMRQTPFDPKEWCEEHFDGRFHVNPGKKKILCEREMDALRATLVFS